MEKSLFEIQASVSKSTLHIGNFWCSSLTGPWIRVMFAWNGWGTVFIFLSYKVFCREYGLRINFFLPSPTFDYFAKVDVISVRLAFYYF